MGKNKLSKWSLRDSLHDLLYNDPDFRKKSRAHITVFGWFEDEKLSSSSSSTSSKLSKGTTIFKKTRLYSSTVYGPCGTVNNHNTRTTRESSPAVKQNFSFTENEQGSVVEPFVNLAEKAIYRFLVNNESIIPLEAVEKFVAKQHPPVSTDFSNADLLCMLNFIIENINIFLKKSVFHGQFKANPVELLTNFKRNVRNKLAHEIVIGEKGRWSDHALQHVTILACEVIICIGGNYEEVFVKKENVDNEIIKRWVDKALQKRKLDVALGDKENVDPQKRKLDEILNNKENIETSRKKGCGDVNFGTITEFTLDILGELSETEKGDKKKILKLFMDENEYVTKFWKAVRTEERKIQLYPHYNKLMALPFVSTEFEGEELRRMKIRGFGGVAWGISSRTILSHVEKKNLLLVDVVVHLSLRAIAQRVGLNRHLPRRQTWDLEIAIYRDFRGQVIEKQNHVSFTDVVKTNHASFTNATKTNYASLSYPK
ncbi:hypothetical protein Glove_227g103 [Diversispora epigaea]|uniref:Uncharacterized protein n=1 Tax=Diversispora epigaea TaxID=1348612 RepID=A0A397IJZ8_9GLOM|nr:hypothetical protein Glove_227g103 [Diversispora epigaea]